MNLPAGGHENCLLADTRSAFPIDRCPGGSTTGALLLGVLSVLKHPTTEEEHVKSDEEIMEILEAFDLTGCYLDAGELAGCSHHTVADPVAARAAGRLRGVALRGPRLDRFVANLQQRGDACPCHYPAHF